MLHLAAQGIVAAIIGERREGAIAGGPAPPLLVLVGTISGGGNVT